MALALVSKFLRQLSRRERIFLYITIIAVFTWVGFERVIEPLIKQIKTLNEDLVTSQLKLIKGERLVNAKERIEEEFSQLAENLKFEGTQEQLISALLNKIEKLSAASGVHINNIKPQRIREFGFYQKTTVEIRLDASIDNIFKFLYELETSEGLIKVERLQLNTKTQESEILDAIVLISETTLL